MGVINTANSSDRDILLLFKYLKNQKVCVCLDKICTDLKFHPENILSLSLELQNMLFRNLFKWKKNNLYILPILESEDLQFITNPEKWPQGQRNLQFILKAIAAKHILALTYQGEIGAKPFFPHRVLFIEDRLCLVAERISNQSLLTLGLNEIHQVQIVGEELYTANFTLKEIDDFLDAMRAISGIEIRLVLKFAEDKLVNLAPAFQYFGQPFKVYSAEGESIWAAHTEPNFAIFEWLASLQDVAEILDPVFLKLQVQNYRKMRGNRL